MPPIIGCTFSLPVASKSITFSHIGQLWLKLPCRVTFFCTKGSSEKPQGCGPQPTLVICPLGLTRSMAIFKVLLEPAASTTVCAPKPSFLLAHSVASPVMVSQPYCRAICKRVSSQGSPNTATSAPHNLAT